MWMGLYYHIWDEHVFDWHGGWVCWCGQSLVDFEGTYAWNCLGNHIAKEGGIRNHWLAHLMGVDDASSNG